MKMKWPLTVVLKFLLWTLIFLVKMASVVELVEGVRIQKTSCKPVVEVGMVCRKVHKFQTLEEVLVWFVFE